MHEEVYDKIAERELMNTIPGSLFRYVISLMLRPAIASFWIAMVAFLTLILLEAGVGYRYNEWLNIISFYFVAAFVYSVLFNVTFWILRVFTVTTSHIEGLWKYIMPAIVAFLVFAQPLSDIVMHVVEGENQWVKLSIALTATAVITIPLLAVIQKFRGYNSILILPAALIGRLILYPLEPIGGNIAEHFWHLLSLLVLIFLTFALFQARYRQQLVPVHERFYVPKPLLVISILFASLFFVYAYIYRYINIYPEAIQASKLYGLIDQHRTTETIPWTLFLLLVIHWFLLSFQMNMLSTPFYERKANMIGMLIITCLLVATGYGGYTLYKQERVSYDYMRPFLKHGGVPYETLSLIAILMDRDHDGNSRWPGGDPDDHNPCIRADHNRGCDHDEKAKQNASSNVLPATVGVNFPDFSSGAPISYRRKSPEEMFAGANQIRLLTFTGVHPDLFLNSRERELFMAAPVGMREIRFVQPSDTTSRNLRALFQGLDGVDEYRKIVRPSVLAEFATIGYRTACVGTDGRRGYFSVASPVRVDDGCQVFQPLDADLSLDDAWKKANVIYRNYRERNNMQWFHFDASLKSPYGTSIISSDKSSMIAESLHSGELIVIFFDRGETLTARMWISTKYPHELTDLRDVLLYKTGWKDSQLLVKSFPSRVFASSSEMKPTGIVTARSRPDNWGFRLAEKLGIPGRETPFTFEYKTDRVELFDPMFGIKINLKTAPLYNTQQSTLR